MSRFRAINQPSKTPSRPSTGAERSLLDAVTHRYGSRPFAVVLPPSTQTQGQSKSKGSLKEAVTKAKKNSQQPREKKRDSDVLKSKPQRVQAPREKKLNLVHSIEYTPRKPDDCPTPGEITDGAGSDYCPSLDLRKTFLSSAPMTPPRRSPRKHGSGGANAGSSAISESSPASSSSKVSTQDGAALGLIKGELSPDLQATTMGRPPSPMIWNKEARQQRYKEADFVELPKEVFEYQKIKKELAIKKQAMLTRNRKEKGKAAEQSSVEETNLKTSKRKAKDQAEHDEPRKRQKSKKLEDISKEVAQASKERSPQKPPKEKKKVSRISQSSNNSRQQKRLHEEETWREPYSRREVYAPESARHPKRHDNASSESIFQFAQDILSTRDQKNSKLRREQSSIPPPIFYGNEGSYRPPTNAGSSSHFATEINISLPSQPLIPRSVQSFNGKINGRMLSKALPTRDAGRNATDHASSPGSQRPNHHAATSPSNYLTSPNSFPLGKKARPGPDVPTRLYTSNSATSGKENLDIRHVPQTLPQVTTGVKPISFRAQRRRHQSVPVGIYSKKTSDENNPLPSPTPRRNDKTLHEVSTNAIVTRLDSLEKVIRDRFPAASNTPVATVTAAAPAISAEQPRTKRKTKTTAERQLTHPVLDSNVPQHLRKSENDLIAIGKNVKSYERHRQAPEAFGYNGRLRASFRHLLVRNVNGVPVWTANEISRISR